MTFAKATGQIERLTYVAQVPAVPTAVQVIGDDGRTVEQYETIRPAIRRKFLGPVEVRTC